MVHPQDPPHSRGNGGCEMTEPGSKIQNRAIRRQTGQQEAELAQPEWMFGWGHLSGELFVGHSGEKPLGVKEETELGGSGSEWKETESVPN